MVAASREAYAEEELGTLRRGSTMRAQWIDGKKLGDGDNWPKDVRHVYVDLDVTDRPETEETVRRLFLPHPMVMNRLLEDAQPRAGVQVYPDVMAATLMTDLEGGSSRPLHIVLAKEFLLTAHRGENPVVEDVWPLTIERGVLKEGPDLVLYLLLRHHLRTFEKRLHPLEGEYEAIHTEMLIHPYRNLAHRILASREHFLKISRHLRPEIPVAELLASSDFPYVRKENRPYLQDLASGMKSTLAEVEASREGLSGTVEAYTSLQSNEINKVMRFLTVISVLALPATTIASIYGMNFKDIPELTWSFGYWYALGLMLAITGTLLFFMRRLGGFR